VHFIVTGATGFIGRAVVQSALSRGHDVTLLVRDIEKARKLFGGGPAKLVSCPALEACVPEDLKRGNDRLIHLAWDGVGKYTDPRNLMDNISPQFTFLQKMAASGVTHQTVAGSCLEYGKAEGALHEDMAPQPVTYYGLAKVTLYRMLMLLKESGQELSLNWLRYFYVYGPGQRAQALLPQLYAAIERGDSGFNMSPGDQSRDFVHVQTAAHNTVVAAEQPAGLGALNIGSGRPVTVKEFAEAALAQKGVNLSLNTGFYGYTDYEPFSFYADTGKLQAVENMQIDAICRMP
jgi:dTDP-6-deoxy-L-talose 4-dehydrogenase (NAD+)